MTSRPVGDCLRQAAEELKSAGIEDPRREARLLMAHAMGRPAEWVMAHPEVDCDATPEFDALIQRRRRREPISHILGEREFWSLPFCVGPDVLDPRPDSETLISTALERFPENDRPISVLDLGTGSGCLLLSFLHERPFAYGIGIDRSIGALAVARENARRLGLEKRTSFVCCDWAASFLGPVDLILSNPPYIRRDDIDSLEPEVALYEPREALDGGEDGLDCYHALSLQLQGIADANTALVLEIGQDQSGPVQQMFQSRGFGGIEVISDLAGLPRCLIVDGYNR